MIKNTELFYERAKQFQDRRAAIMATYESRMASLENARGSRLYEDESKKAEAEKNDALDALKAEYGQSFRIVLEAMHTANAGRKLDPPTEEELRLLQLLRMKGKPTETELSMAANTLAGNATALSILTEISHNAGFVRSYMDYSQTKEMPVNEANSAIDALAASVHDFMEFDTSKAARMTKEARERQYGAMPNAPALPKRRQFTTKAECFSELCNLSGDSLTAFEKAVNG